MVSVAVRAIKGEIVAQWPDGLIPADDARRLIDEIRHDYEAFTLRVLPKAATLYLGRAWLSLGYESWEELWAAEFGGLRLAGQVTRGEQRDITVALRSIGMSNPAIGAVVGVDEGTVRNDLRATSEISEVGALRERYSLPEPPREASEGKTLGRDGKWRKPPRKAAEAAPPVGDSEVPEVPAVDPGEHDRLIRLDTETAIRCLRAASESLRPGGLTSDGAVAVLADLEIIRALCDEIRERIHGGRAGGLSG